MIDTNLFFMLFNCWHRAAIALSEVYLIFVNFSILKFCFTLFLEGNNNEGYEDVDEKERENDEVDDVKNGHLNPVMKDGTVILLRCGHGILQHSLESKWHVDRQLAMCQHCQKDVNYQLLLTEAILHRFGQRTELAWLP